MMPLAAPLALMSWKVTSLAPIAVLLIFSAVPVVVAMWLPDPVTLTVPPPVATKPAPLPVTSMVMLAPVKLKVAALVPPMLTPVPTVVSTLTVPEKVTVVPPVWSVMLMAVEEPLLKLSAEPEKVKLLELSSRTMEAPLPPVCVRLPESVTAPVAWSWILTTCTPAPVLMAPP